MAWFTIKVTNLSHGYTRNNTDRKKMMQDAGFKIIKDNLISCITYLVSFPFRVNPCVSVAKFLI